MNIKIQQLTTGGKLQTWPALQIGIEEEVRMREGAKVNSTSSTSVAKRREQERHQVQ